jgi:hypothetical protein
MSNYQFGMEESLIFPTTEYSLFFERNDNILHAHFENHGFFRSVLDISTSSIMINYERRIASPSCSHNNDLLDECKYIKIAGNINDSIGVICVRDHGCMHNGSERTLTLGHNGHVLKYVLDHVNVQV